MPSVNISECNNNFDVALRRFKRACEKAGIPSALRQREYYEKPAAQRRRRHAAACKRHQKQLFKNREVMVRGRARRVRIDADDIAAILKDDTK